MPPRSEPPTGSTPGSPQNPAAPSPTGDRKPRDASAPPPAQPPANPPRSAAEDVGGAADSPPEPGPAGATEDPGAPELRPTEAAASAGEPAPTSIETARSSSKPASRPARSAQEIASPAPKPTSAAEAARPAASPTRNPTAATTPEPWVDDTENHPSRLLSIALALLTLGAAALTAAAFIPVSPDAHPGFGSWPWLALLALAPAVAAIWAFSARQPRLAGGLVLGLAALAPGRLVLDLQFAVDGPLTIRPELYLPERFLGDSAVGGGFWLLVAGHLLTGAAGVLAWRATRTHDEPERRRWRLLVPLLAVTASVGLLTEPVRSDNGFLLARSAFEGPWPALGGYLLLAAALPLTAVVALAAPSESTARGALAGLTAGAFGVALPPVLAGLYRDDLYVTWGPVVVLGATAVTAGLAFTRLTEQPKDAEREVKLPGLFWWRLTAGALGLATAIAAVVGTFAPQVAVTALNPGAPTPVSAAAESPARWFLLTAAIVEAVLAVGTLVPKTARGARPVFGLAWAGIVLAGTAVLNTALTATQVGNLAGFGATGATPVFTYDLGAGAAWTFAALVLAVLAALAAAGSGVVEREDAGDGTPDGRVLTPVVAGGVLAVAAFGLPVFSVPGYVAPGLWSNFDTPSWGLLTAVVVVVGAAGLALRSRPKPAAALLAGAALLTALHAAELPLVGGALGGASPATGFWVALAAVAALLAAAVMSAGRREP
ncbi:hypothetical protein [Amycolatopsis sp. cmx-4-68]|uniref:hypothetical protein n=1 Tax=Amycolatopsis sp. cmx-4-68 TaxID=2790938 RepID=UPI00397DC385